MVEGRGGAGELAFSWAFGPGFFASPFLQGGSSPSLVPSRGLCSIRSIFPGSSSSHTATHGMRISRVGPLVMVGQTFLPRESRSRAVTEKFFEDAGREFCMLCRSPQTLSYF
ncbi:MAG: hypothetical protein A3G49_05485 [Candidatus Sungbacteria bacterium RIFCSPLOWO2_12_FULL_41_11]|uniref:Uncharacterized protein n=1 Tax=Candidatus Sungbacteria bacterium RIFCSPLOWO2_12_FULL_41_11 TaxID=1802286 RepID=A0A1G2LSX6_9BACT|nr:MAG: hypothetical protein A3G49_05485 [Candidatus Sungbacteria bacterium RIFCSPLOWO2_12_FULL_41_11]